jgi:DNA-binding NarL/FixJ family response regulator
MKIVIVDDDKAMRAVLRAICEGEGHEVSADFGDGYVLLDYVMNHHPDVVCLDFNLPGANGLELLASLDVSANQVDVVMITGSDDPELKGAAANAGAKGFIRKPFEQAQIIAELKDIEQGRRIAAQAASAPEPEVVEPTAPVAAVEPARKVAPGVTPRTAVIVDDSASVRLLLKGIFEEIGIRVVGIAANGREGVEAVKRNPPAMVCLDVDMPIMTGLEALPLIRAASPQTKAVMITGNAGRAIVEAAVAGGAKGYFLKPIRPAKVEEFVKKLLQLR